MNKWIVVEDEMQWSIHRGLQIEYQAFEQEIQVQFPTCTKYFFLIQNNFVVFDHHRDSQYLGQPEATCCPQKQRCITNLLILISSTVTNCVDKQLCLCIPENF
jgi:hypothetical protein